VTAFDLALPRKVVFGPGRAGDLAGLLPTLGTRVLLCTGSDPARHRHLLGDVEPVAVARVTREPLVDDARAVLAQARAAGADAGAQRLDLAKAVAVLLGNGTTRWTSRSSARAADRTAVVPAVAVPTTTAAGARRPRARSLAGHAQSIRSRRHGFRERRAGRSASRWAARPP
jgi:alcohol dehydrogenase class IV